MAALKRQEKRKLPVIIGSKEVTPMGVMPEDRMRRWSKLFRRYGIPDDTPDTMENKREDESPLDSLKDEAARNLFPNKNTREPRKKK